MPVLLLGQAKLTRAQRWFAHQINEVAANAPDQCRQQPAQADRVHRQVAGKDVVDRRKLDPGSIQPVKQANEKRTEQAALIHLWPTAKPLMQKRQKDQRDGDWVHRRQNRNRHLDERSQPDIGDERAEHSQNDGKLFIRNARKHSVEKRRARRNQSDAGRQARRSNHQAEQQAAVRTEVIIRHFGQNLRPVFQMAELFHAGSAHVGKHRVEKRQERTRNQRCFGARQQNLLFRRNPFFLDRIDDDDAEYKRPERVQRQIAVLESFEKRLGLVIAHWRLQLANRIHDRRQDDDADKRQLHRCQDFSDYIDNFSRIERQQASEREEQDGKHNQRKRPGLLGQERLDPDLKRNIPGARNRKNGPIAK